MKPGRMISEAFVWVLWAVLTVVLAPLDWGAIADEPCEYCEEHCGGTCMGAQQ